MALMFLRYGGIGDILFYILVHTQGPLVYIYSHTGQGMAVVISYQLSVFLIRRELLQTCDTRAFFSSVFVNSLINVKLPI